MKKSGQKGRDLLKIYKTYLRCPKSKPFYGVFVKFLLNYLGCYKIAFAERAFMVSFLFAVGFTAI